MRKSARQNLDELAQWAPTIDEAALRGYIGGGTGENNYYYATATENPYGYLTVDPYGSYGVTEEPYYGYGSSTESPGYVEDYSVYCTSTPVDDGSTPTPTPEEQKTSLNSYRISGGSLIETSAGVIFRDDFGSCMFFGGVNISTIAINSNAFQWNGTIHLPNPSNWNITDVIHEYGHYIQQQTLGTLGYLLTVAIPSMLSSIFDNYDEHMARSFEEEATRLGELYSVDAGCDCPPTTFAPW
jgi:hypothetical protein